MNLVYSMHKRSSGPGSVVVLQLSGSVDSNTAPEFGQVMDILLERHGCPLIIDMSAVMYISSAGWREFVTKTQGVIESRIHIRIVGMQPTVRDVFELIGLDHVFVSHDELDDALNALASDDSVVE